MNLQRGALYIRVSTEDQIEYSPDAQKLALFNYAKKNNILVDEQHIYIDAGISGKKAEKRPAFMKMISTAKKKPKPFDVILVHKFDRFSRNREDSVVYKSLLRKDCGVRVISISEHLEDDKFSIILESMLEAMAEYYSLNLAEEVKKGLNEKARRGEPIGQGAYGYDKVEKNLVINPKQAEAIKIIFEKYTVSEWSLLEIARYLNAQGYVTKLGKPFTKRALRYILKNPVYYGHNRYNYRKGGASVMNDESEWIIVKGTHEPLITKETYDLAWNRLKTASKLCRKESSGVLKTWLQKQLRCHKCGSIMRVLRVKEYYYFRCDKAYQGGCSVTKTLSARKLEKIILTQIEHDTKYLKSINIKKIHTQDDMNNLDHLNMQLKKLEKKYELARKAYLAEIDSIEDYKRNKEIINKEESYLLKIIEEVVKSDTVNMDSFKLDQFYSLLTNAETQEEKQRISQRFIDKIIVNLIDKTIEIQYYF